MNTNEASAKIAAILRDLERDSGCVVEGLRIDRLEVTTYKDPGQRFLCTVVIELHRLPGQEWSVGETL